MSPNDHGAQQPAAPTDAGRRRASRAGGLKQRL